MLTTMALLGAILAVEPDAAPAREFAHIPLERNRFGLVTLDVAFDREIEVAHNDIRRAMPFVLDTGASHTGTPLNIAEQLNDGPELVLDEVADATTGPFLTDRFVMQDADFGAGARDIESIVLPVDGRQLLHARGILGASAFDREQVIIDFSQLEMVADPRAEIAAHLRLDPHYGLVLGQARVRGVAEPVRVIIDSGATASIINSALANTGRGPVAQETRVISSVDGGPPMRSERRRMFFGMELGAFCMSSFWISVSDLHVFDVLGWSEEPAMLIGLDMLDASRMSIDYNSYAVALEGVGTSQCR